MAYGIKYQFVLESIHGVEYTVNILKDGYSGSVIKRHLGKAPVLRKSNSGNIQSTTLDVDVECTTDGEFAEFYTTTPGDFNVALFKGNTQIWQGTLVTELYSAPEIAPPYDVRITANDGIALAKEFLYEAQGLITPKELVKYLFSDLPAMGRSIYIVSGIGATDLTPANFWNTATINLDYMVGKTKYDVLNYFLDTIHAKISLHNGNWLISRETDVTVSSGSISCLLAARNSSSITSTSITGAVASAGQMGVATLWPVGHMTTNVSPAKNRVTVEAQNHVTSGAPSVANNGWTIYDSSHVVFIGGRYRFTYSTLDSDYGTIYAHIPLRSFTAKLRLTVSVATYLDYVYNNSDIKIYVSFTPTGGSIKYYNGIAWTTSPDVLARPTLPDPVGTIESPETFSFDISPISEFADGTLIISFEGRHVDLYDAILDTVIGNGYKDTIVINNGARGDEGTVAIAGSRVESTDLVGTSFLQGVFLLSSGTPAQNFYDNNFTGLSFMSLTAMGYALSVALPRLELSGTFNFPSSLSTLPLVVTYGGVNYWVESYELDVLEEELKITALSLPSATLSVQSETVTELSDDEVKTGAYSGGSSSGGGGGGGSSVMWGTTSNHVSPLTVNGTTKDVLLDGALSAMTFGDLASHPTTISGYGITDAKIANGVVTLGSNSITPLTSHQTLYALTLSAGAFSAKTYTPNSAAQSVQIPTTLDHITDGSSRKLADYLPLAGGTLTGDLRLKGSTNYGRKINFGDGDYVHLYEDTDDHLTIHANDGITLSTGSGYGIEASNFIDIGEARLTYDATNKALHITMKDGSTETIGLYADGFVAGGGVLSSSGVKFVTITGAQTVGGNKTLTGDTTFSGAATFSDTATFAITGGTTTIQSIIDRITALENNNQ